MGRSMSELNQLHTEDKLLSKIRESAKIHPTPDELIEQRVSYIFGAISSESSVSREQIREKILVDVVGTKCDPLRANRD